MGKVAKLCFALILPLLITTGCWNLKEPDQLAFITGNGLDLTEEGKLEASTLIATPAGFGGSEMSSGGNKGSFHVMNATGKNTTEAMVHIQSRLSRSVFAGHRDIFLVGQRLAEHGIGKTIDSFIRNPNSDMRALIYVVKNGTPKDVFSIKPFFDPFITSSLYDEQAAIGLKPYLAREFVEEGLSDEIVPLLPVVSINSSKHYSYTGSAILNKKDGLKLVGFLNKKETSYSRWITDRLNSVTLTSYISKGGGNVSLQLHHLGRRIRVKKVDEQIQIDVHLSGGGTIIENDTNLDPSRRKDIQLIQAELNQKTKKSIQQLIKNVQEEYKVDIFGFGKSVHQQYPHQWKTLKRNWTETFPNIHVSVEVDLHCNDPGQTNASLNIY